MKADIAYSVLVSVNIDDDYCDEMDEGMDRVDGEDGLNDSYSNSKFC